MGMSIGDYLDYWEDSHSEDDTIPRQQILDCLSGKSQGALGALRACSDSCCLLRTVHGKWLTAAGSCRQVQPAALPLQSWTGTWTYETNEPFWP